MLMLNAQVKVIPLPDVVNPASVTLDENQLYITEGTSIYIYSLTDFKLIKKFGKRGEGPREFLPPFGGNVNIDVQPNGLMVISAFKLSYFSKQGDYKKELRLPVFLLTNRPIRPLAKGFAGSALQRGTKAEKNLTMISYNIYDSNFKVIKEFYRTAQGYQGPQSNVQFNPFYWTLLEPSLYVYDNNIFLGHYGEHENGVIYVFDSKGKKLYDINPPYEKVEFTSEDKEASKDEFVTRGNKQFYETNKHLFKLSSYFPLRQYFQVVDQKIYIQTYKRSKQGERTEFLILDLKGDMLKRVMLPLKYTSHFSPYSYGIKNEKLYQIVENEEEEEYQVHIIEIDTVK
jgi:hypothetical protein